MPEEVFQVDMHTCYFQQADALASVILDKNVNVTLAGLLASRVVCCHNVKKLFFHCKYTEKINNSKENMNIFRFKHVFCVYFLN